MAYQSLYRKYRPQRFEELVGQEHVTNALRNAVRDGRVGHAYLFSGPRGTGKTTTARILAKALNCTNLGADGEPDGECDNCRAIADGTFMDLREIDAASNRGVDDARDLRQKVAMGMGANTRHKVYILDEVHMLSNDAANTLLKTLEEPPEHVVFVLATTNPESVLPTIRSRTQHFEFTLLSTEQLARPPRRHLRARGRRGRIRGVDDHRPRRRRVRTRRTVAPRPGARPRHRPSRHGRGRVPVRGDAVRAAQPDPRRGRRGGRRRLRSWR